MNFLSCTPLRCFMHACAARPSTTICTGICCCRRRGKSTQPDSASSSGLLSGLSSVGSWLGGPGSHDNTAAPQDVLATLEGSWLSHLNCTMRSRPALERPGGSRSQHQSAAVGDGGNGSSGAPSVAHCSASHCLWSVHDSPECKFESVPMKERLATDCTFREDMQLLAKGDVKGAAAAKQRLEEQQRKMRKQMQHNLQH